MNTILLTVIFISIASLSTRASTLGCVMTVDTDAEQTLERKTGKSYLAYKTLHPCQIEVSPKTAKCAKTGICGNYPPEYSLYTQCFQIKQDGEKSFTKFSGTIEGLDVKPGFKYVLEVEKLKAYDKGPADDDDCGGGSEAYDKYLVKKVISQKKNNDQNHFILDQGAAS